MDTGVVGAAAAPHVPDPQAMVRAALETWVGTQGLLLCLGYVLDSSCPWTRLGVLPWRSALDGATLRRRLGFASEHCAFERALRVAAAMLGGSIAG